MRGGHEGAQVTHVRSSSMHVLHGCHGIGQCMVMGVGGMMLMEGREGGLGRVQGLQEPIHRPKVVAELRGR